MQSIQQDVAAYERWLRQQCAVVEKDLDEKHARMRKNPFDFLRATYFRWAQIIEDACPTLAAAPRIPCVGDIHIENFGTWRDADGRLVWGINDFDEAAVMPYAYDLVRLTTSALLTPELNASAADIASAVLTGYRRGLAAPAAVLMDEGPGWLRSYAEPTPKTNRDFWHDVDEYPAARPPKEVRKALQKSLPSGANQVRFATRRKGGGSLGRPRFVVVATWKFGRVVREAKALVPSAWDWAHRSKRRSVLLDVAFGRFRSPDPHLHVVSGFGVRRIAPDARKIEIEDVEVWGLTAQLLAVMAADLAAVHAASGKSKRLVADLDSRPHKWLQEAAETARKATKRDFDAYSAA